MMITALNGHISATVLTGRWNSHAADSSRLKVCSLIHRTLVTEASIKGYRGLYVADVDTDVGMPMIWVDPAPEGLGMVLLHFK